MCFRARNQLQSLKAYLVCCLRSPLMKAGLAQGLTKVDIAATTLLSFVRNIFLRPPGSRLKVLESRS